MTVRLLREADLAGHIREKTGDDADPCIGIKPNLVTPTPAMYGATTHPEVVEGIIRYLQEHGYTNLMICEGSWVGDKTSEAFEYCGYNTLAEKYGVRLFDTQKDSSYAVTCQIPAQLLNPAKTGRASSKLSISRSDSLELHLCSCLKEIDFLINVPVLKGHCQTKMTCALKNMKGLIPNSEKRRFHSLGLHKPIAYLNTVIHQDFIVVDHICGDPDFEEGGNPLVTNCIMAALDPVLTDTYACKILNYRPDEVEYVQLAAKAGVGSKDPGNLEVRQIDPSVSMPGNAEKGLSSPKPRQIEPLSANEVTLLTHKALQLNYATQEIDSCSACYSALTEALHRLNEEGLLHKLTDELHITFHIGQGYRGLSEPTGSSDRQPIPGQVASACTSDDPAVEQASRHIGIGNCTCLFAKNIPGCPPSENEIYYYLKLLLQ